MMMTIYGLKNCDSCRKAVKFCTDCGLKAELHDLRGDGLPASLLAEWLAHFPASELINTRSTTWRQLDDARRQQAETDPQALLQAHPTLIKRPVIHIGGDWLLGFRASQMAAIKALAAGE